MQPLWLCPPRLLLLYFCEWAGLFSNNTAERNHWFPFALPSDWRGVCRSVWYVSSHPHHCHWLSYLQWFMASLSSPLQWEEIFIHLFSFGWSYVAALGRYREKRPQDGPLRTLQQILCYTSVKWSERGSRKKWVRWNSKAKWKERKKAAALFVWFFVLDFIHSEIRHFKLRVSRCQQEEYLE